MTSIRFVAAASCAVLVTACYTQFWPGPQLGQTPKTVRVEVEKCSTPPRLFDCQTVASVGLFLQDFFALNGVSSETRANEGGALKVSVREDTNVVSIELELRVAQGQVWRAQAQGGDVLLALVRFEELAQKQLGLKVKYATSENLAEPMKKFGRTRLVLMRKDGAVSLEYK